MPPAGHGRPMQQCIYTEMEHTAEIGLRIQAESPAALYACAARAMFSLLRTQPDTEAPPISRPLEINAADAESLLVDWLNELLFLYETTGAIYVNCRITHWSPTRLEAEAIGFPPRDAPTLHIKAVTYHQLRIAQSEDRWSAEVYLDI